MNAKFGIRNNQHLFHGLLVLRGGSFRFRDHVRCAARFWCHPKNKDYAIGFRVVLSPVSEDVKS